MSATDNLALALSSILSGNFDSFTYERADLDLVLSVTCQKYVTGKFDP